MSARHRRLTKHVLGNQNLYWEYNECNHQLPEEYRDGRFARSMVHTQYLDPWHELVKGGVDPLRALVQVDPFIQSLLIDTMSQIDKLRYMLIIDPHTLKPYIDRAFSAGLEINITDQTGRYFDLSTQVPVRCWEDLNIMDYITPTSFFKPSGIITIDHYSGEVDHVS